MSIWYKSKINFSSDLTKEFFQFVATKRQNVKLKGEVLKKHSALQGFYTLQPNNVNGRPHWSNKQYAIWYIPPCSEISHAAWMIGNKRDVGKHFGYLHSADDVAEPQMVTTWQANHHPNPKHDIIVYKF